MLVISLADIAPSPDEVKGFFHNIAPDMITFFVHVFIGIGLWFAGKKLMDVLCKILEKTLLRQRADARGQKIILALAKGICYTILIVTIAGLMGIPMTSFFTLLGTAGLAIVLSIKEYLANLAGGIILLLIRPFQVGDYIMEDSNKNEGTVKDIGLFYTTLSTADNRIVLIPNGLLSNTSLTNVTAQEKRCVTIKIGISYQSDLKLAKTVLSDLIARQPKRLQEEEWSVVVAALEDSAVIIQGRLWVKTKDYWAVYWQLTESVKLLFDEQGLAIAHKELDVYLR